MVFPLLPRCSRAWARAQPPRRAHWQPRQASALLLHLHSPSSAGCMPLAHRAPHSRRGRGNVTHLPASLSVVLPLTQTASWETNVLCGRRGEIIIIIVTKTTNPYIGPTLGRHYSPCSTHTVVPPYLRGICSKMPDGCLKPGIVLNSIYTRFSPIHGNL